MDEKFNVMQGLLIAMTAKECCEAMAKALVDTLNESHLPKNFGLTAAVDAVATLSASTINAINEDIRASDREFLKAQFLDMFEKRFKATSDNEGFDPNLN